MNEMTLPSRRRIRHMRLRLSTLSLGHGPPPPPPHYIESLRVSEKEKFSFFET